MAQPWRILETIATAEGHLELRQRGEKDFLITIGGRILMNAMAHRSEVALGRLACGHLKMAAHPRVLVGGLGMGYTLRAVLDTLPATATVVVAERKKVRAAVERIMVAVVMKSCQSGQREENWSCGWKRTK